MKNWSCGMIIVLSLTIGVLAGICIGSRLASAAYRQVLNGPPREMQQVRHVVRWDLTVCKKCHSYVW